jgi:hypothetical protein
MKEAWINLYDDVQLKMVRAGDISEELAAPPRYAKGAANRLRSAVAFGCPALA